MHEFEDTPSGKSWLGKTGQAELYNNCRFSYHHHYHHHHRISHGNMQVVQTQPETKAFRIRVGSDVRPVDRRAK